MNENQVLQALVALAKKDSEREAPPEVEARLLHDFHSRGVQRQWRWQTIAALAAGIVLAAFLVANRAPKSAARTAAPVTSAIEMASPAPAPLTPVARKVALKVVTARHAERREVVTDFFPLMSPAPPFERGQMLRVQLPASAMQTVGLPVSEEHLADPIQADVLVGEEGMPRAIRFVRFDVR